MTSENTPAASCPGEDMRDLKWSPKEKAVARRAFDLALERDLKAVILEAKSKAAAMQETSDLWKLEEYLTRQRQKIDRRYDYRYSVLPAVFAELLRDGRLNEDELQGLGGDKLDFIRRAARAMSAS
jgi:Photoprotection regulator fluorescence recovery protein